MAITRAQIARELYIKGGVVNPDGRRGFGGGADMGTVGTDGKQGGKGSNKDLSGGYQGGTLGGYGDAGRDDKPSKEVRDRQKQKYEQQFGGVSPTGSRPRSIFDRINTFNKNYQRRQMINLAKKRADDLYSRLENYVVGDTDMDYDFTDAPKGLETLTSNKGTSIESTRPNLYTVNPNVNFPSVLGVVQDKIRPDTQVTLQNTLNKARDYTGLIDKSSSMTNQELRDAMTDLQNRGKTDDQINSREGEGGQQPIYIPPVVTSDADDLDDDYYASVGGNPFENRNAYRLFNKGGIADTVVGGEYDFESARQMYGLGKLVKKVTKTVKKIAKSPIGKAALLYAGGTYLGGLKAFGGTGFGSGNFLANLKTGQGIGNLSRFASSKLFGNVAYDDAIGTKTGGLLERLGLKNLSVGKAGLGIAGISALAGLMTKGSEEDEDEEQYRGEGLDIDAIRANPFAFTPRRFAAEGGDIEKEPVAKKTMPLLDMDGKEMDLREEGGFVPIGRMEKADDVPARLSKNEFVFTADAVRNAGDGDVDLGAEKMYNMMKNLESGGDVSEESQGLEGARKMFQTSQRLEEVI